MEDNIRNKIITISGEPVSGKGTTIKKLVELLKEKGYSDEQIHIICTGDAFRRYSNAIIQIIANLDNVEKLEALLAEPEMQELLSNREYKKLLSKTILKIKGDNIDISKYTVEQSNNSEEFKYVRTALDSLIDESIKAEGKKINSAAHPNDIWIIDSRLAFANIPKSFAVRLTTKASIAGQRLYNDTSRGIEDSKYKSVEEATEEREKRRIGERSRYLERYGIDLEDVNNYNLILDTSNSTAYDIADIILKTCENYYTNQQFRPKCNNSQENEDER